MGQKVITIGREYGSGGLRIAEIVAEHYGIKLYSKRLLAEVAKDSQYSEEILEKFDERPVNVIFSPMPMAGVNSIPLEQGVAMSQFSFLRKKANEDKESFVVVGRCSNEILEDNEHVARFFILADYDSKLKRLMDRDHISEKEAASRMKRADKMRKSYHNFYCETKWGDSRGYDLCINTSKISDEQAAEIIIAFVDSINKE